MAAWAHAQLIRSMPADKAELSRSPTQVELWFNELLENSFNSVNVYPAGEFTSTKRPDFADGKPQVDPKDRTHLTVKVKALAPGEYIAQWRVLSRDGHSAPGRFSFRIKAPETSRP